MSYFCKKLHTMSLAKPFRIRESESAIKKLMKSSNAMIGKRLHALLIFKQHEDTGISKRHLADEIGVNHNSIQTWRSAYIEGGIKALMAHSNTGYKESKIKGQQEKALKNKLSDPFNGIVGFNELLQWFNTTFKTEINYKTFYGFVVRKYKAKVKVARKSHVKKDPAAVEAFKKTSVSSVKKSSQKIKPGIKG